jgi:uncharacterized protein YegP (UPF0339 family)
VMPAKTKFKIEVLASGETSWYWRLKSARNGQILATSEVYVSKKAALNTIRSIIKTLLPETADQLPVEILNEPQP